MKKIFIFLLLVGICFAQQTRVNQLRSEKVISKNVTSTVLDGDSLRVNGLTTFYRDGDTTKSNCNMSFLGTANFTGNLTADGYLTGKKSGVYSYVDTTISIVTVDSLHLVSVFENSNPLQDFKLVGDTLVYTGSKQYFEGLYFASISADVDSTTISLAIESGDSVYSDQKMLNFSQYSGQSNIISGNLVFEVDQYDTLYIRAEADSVCSLDFKKLTISIKEFFD